MAELRQQGDALVWEQTDGAVPERVHDASQALCPTYGAVVIGDCDWVRLPEELGGHRAYVKSRSWMDIRCPKCQAQGPIFTMLLEDVNISVLCCQSCKQYIWIRTLKEDKSVPDTE